MASQTVEELMERIKGGVEFDLGYFQEFVATYAIQNEFGDKTHPERSYIRAVVHSLPFQVLCEMAISRYMQGDSNKDQMILEVLEGFRKLIAQYIADKDNFVPNSERVAKNKGGNEPLMFKGKSNLIDKLEVRK